MIKLANGATVIRAELIFPSKSLGALIRSHGVVLARSHNDYVVWSVMEATDAEGNTLGTYDAFNGDYFSRAWDDLAAFRTAYDRYMERREN